MTFEAARIHFLGDVFAPVVVVVVAWWLSDRVTNRWEVLKMSFQNNISILSFIFTIRAFPLRILHWRRYTGM